MRWRIAALITAGLVFLCLAVGILYSLPPVHSRLAWRVENLRAQIQRIIRPPEKVLFIPQEHASSVEIETVVFETLAAIPSTGTPSPQPSETTEAVEQTITPAPSATASPSPTPTASPTEIPERVVLSGITHEYQLFNNCGPANLAMALSYWDWQGDQRDTRAFLRPNLEVDDKNVMPAEMVSFIQTRTGLNAITRMGGTNELLKKMIAAGFPVLIEAGHHPADDWWMGHYILINGYDDAQQRFVTQDSLISPDLPMSYEELESKWWRDFNYVYLVIYPEDREAELFEILNSNIDQETNYRQAAQKAIEETTTLSGRDLFFAWFNLGSSLVGLGDYPGAAQAYDRAFEIYQTLSEELRPYRLMWYQVGPYEAYYYSNRFQDVVDLANATFAWVGKPVLEESFYWRGLAYQALGNLEKAKSDLTKASQLNPNFTEAFEALERLGD